MNLTSDAISTESKLTLPERILLLALNDESGEIERGVSSDKLERALIVAAIVELVLRGRLRCLPPDERAITTAQLGRIIRHLTLDDQRYRGYSALSEWNVALYEVSDTSPTGHSYLDQVLVRLESLKPEQTHTLGGLAQKYVNFSTDSAQLEEAISAAKDLIANGVLELRNGVSGGLFRKAQAFRLAVSGNRDSGEDSLRLRLVEAVAGDQILTRPITDARFIATLCLVRAVGLIDAVFGREKRDAVDWRIASLCKTSSDSLLGFADHYVRSGQTSSDELFS